MDFNDLLETHVHNDFLRAVAEAILQVIMKAGFEGKIGRTLPNPGSANILLSHRYPPCRFDLRTHLVCEILGAVDCSARCLPYPFTGFAWGWATAGCRPKILRVRRVSRAIQVSVPLPF